MREEWSEEELGSKVDVLRRGITPKYTDALNDDSLIVINQKCIRDSRINLNQARITKRVSSLKEDRLLQYGDVLVNSTGVGTLGRTAQFLHHGMRVTADSHVTILRPNSSIDTRFFGYLVGSKEQEIEDMAAGSTGQTELSPSLLGGLPLLLPPIVEQRAIADALNSFDELIDTNRRLARDFWSLAENLYLKHVEGLGTTAASETMVLKYGKSLPKKTWSPGRVLVTSSAGIVGRHNVALAKGPGVVVGRVGTAGSVTWVPDDFFVVENAFYVTSELPLVWCYFQLKFANLPSLSSASAVPAINREAALAQQVPIARPDDIRTLCTSLERLIQSADELEREIEELEQARDAILPALLSGKITPNSAAKLLEDVTK